MKRWSVNRRLAAVALLAAHPVISRKVAAQDRLDPVERRLARAADQDVAAGIALLERIVNQNSGSRNPAGVKAVGDILRSELDGLGFTTRWIDGAEFQRAGHLIAERRGQGPRILLIGHLDTVFEPDSPFQKFERIDSMTARGPGIIDMKGGDVIIVQALKALRAAGVLERMNLVVVMTGDEESAGTPLELARRPLIEAAKAADIAIGFEDGAGLTGQAVIARRGFSSWLLTVTGTPAHSSQIFRDDVGAGAIFETARVLQQLRERLAGRPYLTFNPGVALGGTTVVLDSSAIRGTAFGKTNVIAERMTVTGDLRTLSPEQQTETEETMRGIAAAGLPHTKSVLTFERTYPPMPPTEGNRRLLATYDQVSRDLGVGAVVATDPMRAGAADVSFAAPHVKMAIDGIGLAGQNDHTVNETADLSAFPTLVKRAAVLLYRLSRGPIP